jgi:hypothetical protein
MTTIENIRHDGWIEVERLQGDLSREKLRLSGMGQVDLLSGDGSRCRERIDVLSGRIQGMVYILNMLG